MPKPCRSRAIVGKQFLQAVVLRICIYVLEARQLFHFSQQNRTPFRKVSHIVRLNSVLVERR